MIMIMIVNGKSKEPPADCVPGMQTRNKNGWLAVLLTRKHQGQLAAIGPQRLQTNRLDRTQLRFESASRGE